MLETKVHSLASVVVSLQWGLSETLVRCLHSMINGSPCIRIVLKEKDSVNIQFKGQVQTEYISMVTNR